MARAIIPMAVATVLVAPAAAVTYAGLPFGYYTPDTGPAFGVYAAAFFRLPGSTAPTRDSYLQPMAVYTWKRQFRFDLNGDIYSPAANWRLVARNRYEKYPTTYWPPPGAADVPKEYYADYTRRMLRFDAEGYRRLRGPFYAGIGAFGEDYAVVDWAGQAGYHPDGEYAPGAAGGFIVGPIVFVEYDSRDRRNATTEGLFARASFSVCDRGAASDYSFREYEVDVRFYWPLARWARKWTLANRLYLSGRDGTPPFWAMAELGGSAVLRGEPEGRARGRWLVAYQEEVRVPLWWRFVGALFMDAGDVGFTMSEFSFKRAKLSAGGGLRLDLVEDGEARVRLDYGRGKDAAGVYLVFSEAF